jgi:hypothetical protein
MKYLFSLSILFSMLQFANAQYDTVFVSYNSNEETDEIIYKTDTILYKYGEKRNILFGTTILPGTSNQIDLYNAGLTFEKVEKSECQNNGGEVHKQNGIINSIIVNDSTFVVDINVYDNCCYDFLCDASFTETGVLNLINTGYGSFCACNCCYGLTYYFSIIDTDLTNQIVGVMINNIPDSCVLLQNKAIQIQK